MAKQTRYLTVRVTPQVRRRLTALARRSGCSVSDLCRTALSAYLTLLGLEGSDSGRRTRES